MLIGLCGKPSVGKSSFFKAATLAEAAIASYPFTTLKSQEGIGFVRVECADKHFNTQCNPRFGYCINHIRFVPIKILDVPGLIEGSHKGLGMGNQFLSDLNEADALIHIIDISGSTNEKGELVKPLSHDPIKDVEFLENELDMWYYQIMKKKFEVFAKTTKENQNIKKAFSMQLSGLRVTEDMVEKSIKKLNLIHHPKEWNDNDLKSLSKELRKLSKPMIIAANKIDVEGSEFNLKRLKEKYKDYTIIPCSADSELALKEAAKNNLIKYVPGSNSFEIIGKLSEKQKLALEFIQKNILTKYNSTGVQDVIDYTIFNLLKYIAIFPGGVNKLQDSSGKTLPDCLLLKENSTALDFAYAIHTDLGKGFIRAINVKSKQTIGKDYKLKNLDVIEIII